MPAADHRLLSLRPRNGSVESAVHILCGVFILIGLLALAASHPVLAIVIGAGLYVLWRTC